MYQKQRLLTSPKNSAFAAEIGHFQRFCVLRQRFAPPMMPPAKGYPAQLQMPRGYMERQEHA